MMSMFSQKVAFPETALWAKMQQGRRLDSFTLELTRRCNNNCRHCYINLPVQDEQAAAQEVGIECLERIASEAVDLGAVWCSLTGGEPLVRLDFEAVYLMLKRKGLLVSVMTNACLVNQRHIDLWKQYPPRDIEVSVYGITAATYESVTRIPGSFKAFMRGVELLQQHGIKVRYKAVAIRSTFAEMPQIADFCRKNTKDYFRFDPLIHSRFDGDVIKNAEIHAERLAPDEIVALEAGDFERARALENKCHHLLNLGARDVGCGHLFYCQTGKGNFVVSPEGEFRLCSSLIHPDCVYSLLSQPLKEAWERFAPLVQHMRSDDPEFLSRCRQCQIIDLCLWCPAHAYLETGKLDKPVEYFCRVAHARVEALIKQSGNSGESCKTSGNIVK